MTPRKWPVITNPADVLHEIRRGSEVLIAGDMFENAVAEWLAITSDRMEYGGAVEVKIRENVERQVMVVDDKGLGQPDWTVALKVARAARERQRGGEAR